MSSYLGDAYNYEVGGGIRNWMRVSDRSVMPASLRPICHCRRWTEQK